MVTLDPATCTSVPKASKHNSPHSDSATSVGLKWPNVVRGRWRKKRVAASLHNLRSGQSWEVKPPALVKVACEGCQAERIRKDGKSLKTVDTTQKGTSEGQQTRPTKQPRRCVKVARKGCREEKVKKYSNERPRITVRGDIVAGWWQRVTEHCSTNTDLDNGKQRAFPLSISTRKRGLGVKSGLTAYKTASTNGLPTKAAGPATMIPTQQRACRCQWLPNAAHPTATPRLREEGVA
ncbi:hypothetical protein EI94DRAFT_1703651 [Lactarius quietus]|nr:hypothetical protein EI94DRAFT_1703651 [Lactarius quietus]